LPGNKTLKHQSSVTANEWNEHKTVFTSKLLAICYLYNLSINVISSI